AASRALLKKWRASSRLTMKPQSSLRLPQTSCWMKERPAQFVKTSPTSGAAKARRRLERNLRPRARGTDMLEMLLCSMLTILPDYLFRRYVQGKRLGKDITLYSMWFELRWGITSCVILTVSLITVIFYNHPSTTSVTLFFRTVPILPETNGRVAEIYVG